MGVELAGSFSSLCLARPRRPPAKIVGASHATCPFHVLQATSLRVEEHTETGL